MSRQASPPTSTALESPNFSSLHFATGLRIACSAAVRSSGRSCTGLDKIPGITARSASRLGRVLAHRQKHAGLDIRIGNHRCQILHKVRFGRPRVVEQEFLELVQYEDHRSFLLFPPTSDGGRQGAIPRGRKLCCRSAVEPRFEARMPAGNAAGGMARVALSRLRALASRASPAARRHRGRSSCPNPIAHTKQ